MSASRRISRQRTHGLLGLLSTALSLTGLLLFTVLAPVAGAQAPNAVGFGEPFSLPRPGELSRAHEDPTGVAAEGTEQEARIPGHYIVVLKGSVEHPTNVAEAQTESHGGEVGFVYRHALKGYSAQLSRNAVEALRNDPRVKYVEPDYRVEAFSQTIPTGIQRIGDTENATAHIDGQDDRVNVDVAVIDTGVDYSHPDLNVYKRTNCVPPGEGEKSEEESLLKQCTDNSGSDGFGHGTHVAGTIGALDNGEGVVGVAPGARLWSVRVFSSQGYGSIAWLIAGIDWVTSHASEIEVANMSVGCGPFVDEEGKLEACKVPALDEAIAASTNAGVVNVVAAGNSAVDAKYVAPANNPDVITVSALADYDGKAGGGAEPLKQTECKEPDQSGEHSYGSDDTLAWFSDYGSDVDVSAPGVCILSTLPLEFGTGYGYLSGTSMASPHVAGVAALLASKSNPNSRADVEAIRQQIVNEGSQNWTDIWTWGDPNWGEEYTPAGEGSYDSIQEPVADVRPQGSATYTTRATKRKYTSATLNGGVNPNGTATSYQFEFVDASAFQANGWTSAAKVPASPKSIGSGNQDVKMSEAISNLKTNTTYHYRLATTTGAGTTYGADKPFNPATTFYTSGAVNVEASSATLEGRISPLGLETSYQFEYVADSDFQASGWTSAVKAPKSPKGIGSGTNAVSVSQLAEGLKPNTVYHYRLVVTNKDGTASGNDKPFTTPQAVLTKAASGTDTHRARLEASVNPIGQSTSYQFEWGTSKSYGHVVPTAPTSIGSGIKALAVSQVASGLKPSTTYHFRVSAVSGNVHTYGEDLTFITADTEFQTNQAAASVSGGTCEGCEIRHLSFRTLWGIYDNPELGTPHWIECDVPGLQGEVGVQSAMLSSESLSARLGNGARCLLPPSVFGFSMEATLEPNNCEVEFHPGNERRSGGSNGSLDVGGTGCQGMTINFASSPGNPPNCKITIGPQHGIPTGYRVKDVGKGAAVEAIASGPSTYTQEGRFCVDGTYGGSLIGGWDLYAYSKAVQPAGLHLSHATETAVTGTATEVGPAKATLNGVVKPQGLSTNYQFKYVGAEKYKPEATDPYEAGSVVPITPASAGSSQEAVAVKQTIEGLETHHTYHFRLMAESAEGTTYGKDELFTTESIYEYSFGSQGSGVGQLSSPRGAALDAGGDIWVADSANNRVEEFNAKGEYLNQFGSYGSGAGQLKEPADVAITAGGDIWVADRGNARLEEFSSEGKYLAQFSAGEGNEFFKPSFDELSGIAIAPDGHIWIVNSKGVGVLEYTASGQFVEWHSGGGYEPSETHEGIAIDPEGDPYISDATHRVTKLDTKGKVLLVFGAGVNGSNEGSPDICTVAYWCRPGSAGSGRGQFNGPQAVDVEPSGNVLVTDKTDGRVQEFAPSGEYVSQFGGAGQIKEPQGIAAGRHGAIYVSDTGNNRIQVWCAPVAPEAITSVASSVGGSEATLHGTVNPGCAATTYQFEYGPTKAYGSKVPVEAKSIGSGTNDIALSESLQGLAPRTNYHFRLVATNARGTSYGEDVEFSTWGTWSTQSTPNIEPRTEAKLEAVSCASATMCMGVGNDVYTGRAFGELWNGTEWKTVIRDAEATLYGIKCVSTTSCIAVGKSPGGAPRAERWWKTGTIWNFAPYSVPSPSGSEAVLQDISCTAESPCTAVGSYNNGTRRVTLAERYNGSEWSIQTTANPASGQAELFGVSCDSATSCTATGAQDSGTLAERWNGSAWSIQTTPNPAGGSASRLERISCTSASFCMAVGNFAEGSGKKTLAERWNGTSWSIVATPNPGAGKGNSLLGVSCSSSTACIAVGRYVVSLTEGLGEGFATEERTLALSWGGSEWATQSSANPEGKKLPRLTGVSCTSSTACTAVGWAKKEKSATADITTLAERYE